MIPVLVGAVGALVSYLAMWCWLKPPRPAWWWLAASAAISGAAIATMCSTPALWPLSAVTATAAAVSWHDARTQLIPDTLNVTTTALVLAAAWAAWASGGTGETWLRAGLAAAALGAGYLLLGLFGSLGLGDVKYAMPLGFAAGWYGWGLVWQATLLSFAVGAVAAVALLVAGKARTAHMAFGPVMALGASLTGVLVAVLAR